MPNTIFFNSYFEKDRGKDEEENKRGEKRKAATVIFPPKKSERIGWTPTAGTLSPHQQEPIA